MILILLFYLLITATCLWTGYYSCFFLQKLVPPGTNTYGKGAAVYLLWGLVVMTLAGELIELFVPVNQLSWLVWLLLLSGISVYNRNLFFVFLAWCRDRFGQHKKLLIPAAVILFLVSTLGAGPLMMDDTESYHIQSIKWIQEWGTVPGLANLHERYGFNSGWFTWAAFFIPKHALRNYYGLANGVLSCWTGLYLVRLAFPSRHTPKGAMPAALPLAAFFVLLTALVCWPMIRGNATTANYDFITTCTVLAGGMELLRLTRSGRPWTSLLPELLVWPAFLFTIRIINFPLLLLSLFGVIHLIRTKTYALLSTCLLIAALFFGAFLIRNVLLSGYLFYPAYQLDLFRVDWKADLQQTKDLVYYIKYYNRINNAFLPLRETAKLGVGAWIPLWFRYLTATDKLVLAGGLTGYLSWFWKLKKWRNEQSIFSGVMILQLAAWFVIAPDPRFIYGPLLMGVFLLFHHSLFTGLKQAYAKYQQPLQALLLLVLLLYTGLKAAKNSSYQNLFQPVEIPRPVTQTVVIDSIPMQIPQIAGKNWNARCYATGLPCVYRLHPRLHARGKSMKEGFALR